jgi:hypothetical protein
MLLFDDIERTDMRPKKQRESTYSYYNSSSRPAVAAVRDILRSWFDSYPAKGKGDLLARLQSPIDSQHLSAFWELYLHELFTGLGYALEPHPKVPDSPNHPEFLVNDGQTPKFYLEATVAGLPSKEEAGADARLAEVFDLVNKMDVPNYHLEVEHRGVPNTPPSVRKIRQALQEWFHSLDSNAIDAECHSGEFDALPRFEWSHDGLTLFFRPIPKSPPPHGSADARAIGITMGEGHLITVDQDIRDAVESKAKKYGRLALPLVVAVNVVCEHCDDIDIDNALFGSETIKLTSNSDGSPSTTRQRLPNGVWFGKNRCRNQYVSAVLLASQINPYSAGNLTPVLVHNPYPENSLDSTSYPMQQSVPDMLSRTMKQRKGRSASEFLRLPNPWPPVAD